MSELDAFEEALKSELRLEIDEDPVSPDLHAVLTRARAIDPSRVDDATLEETRELAPVVSLRRRAPARQDESVQALAPFEDALRSALDQELERGRVPQPRASTTWRPRAVAVAVACAASVALLFAAWRGLSVPREAAPIASQAELVRDGGETTGAAVSRSRPGSGAGVAREGSTPRAPEPEDRSPADDVSPSPSGVVSPGSSAVAADGAEGSTTTAVSVHERGDGEPGAPTTGASLRALDRRARAAWRAGKLGAAESLFREMIERGGRHRLVELAFGDMFTLVRQRHGEHAQPRVWREYLARFPRGRFADDARAGLCQRAKGDAARRCWRRYLRRHPDGTHAATARAEGGKP